MASSKTVEKKSDPVAFGAPRIFVLAASAGPDPHLVHRLVRPETVVGRGPEADFLLPDDEISASHMRIRVDGGQCYATDLGSLNGTELNGRRLEPGTAARLKPLDELRLGRTSLVFMRGEFVQP